MSKMTDFQIHSPEEAKDLLSMCKGYKLEGAETQEVQKIHCEKGRFTQLANGFSQTYAEVEGQKCRVCIYLPTQSLQPHCHDGDEKFVVTSGQIQCIKWDKGTPGEAASTFTTCHFKAGDLMEVPAGVYHSIYAHAEEGCVFHEIVGDFAKRQTQFFCGEEMKEKDGQHILGSDGMMRFYDNKTIEYFKGKTVVITGSSRGLGLELAEQFLACQSKVIATCRNPATAAPLLRTEKYFDLDKNIICLPCDVSNSESITKAAKQIEEASGGQIDVLINNAGISSPDHPKDPILSSSEKDMLSVFNTNIIGTVLLTQAMVPLLDTKGSLKTIMNMSSQLGSIANTFGCQGKMGGVACYRMSRAANNMALRTFAGELHEREFTCIAMSPGHVFTDMGSSGGRNPELKPKESIGGILKVLAGSSNADNGKFLQYDGKELPW